MERLELRWRMTRFLDLTNIIFLISFYLQAVHVHLGNGVNLKKKKREEECSVAHLQIQQVQGLI
jgi:hypothetical protein